MDKLQALFRALLKERRATLLDQRARLDGGDAEDAWAVVMKEAHTLKGSGGQFGFPEITDAALALRTAAPAERRAAFGALLDVIDGVVAEDAPAVAGAPDETPDAPAAPASKKHVLLVEDDPLIASVIGNALRQHGFVLTHCHLGAEALGLLRAGAPAFDLALLDISMPGISGLEVLRQVRAAPATADLPVLMVSAHADASTITYAKTLGADAYLTKPFSPAQLVRHVQALVDAQRRTRAAFP